MLELDTVIAICLGSVGVLLVLVITRVIVWDNRKQDSFLRQRRAGGYKDEVDRLHHVLKTEIGVTMSDGGDITKNLPDAVTKK
jgi:hypothetical protein